MMRSEHISRGNTPLFEVAVFIMFLSLVSCDLPSDLVQMDAQSLPEIVDTGLFDQESEAEFDTAGNVHELLTGDFDSTEQANSDPEFYAVSLRMCAVDVPVRRRQRGARRR